MERSVPRSVYHTITAQQFVRLAVLTFVMHRAVLVAALAAYPYSPHNSSSPLVSLSHVVRLIAETFQVIPILRF